MVMIRAVASAALGFRFVSIANGHAPLATARGFRFALMPVGLPRLRPIWAPASPPTVDEVTTDIRIYRKLLGLCILIIWISYTKQDSSL